MASISSVGWFGLARRIAISGCTCTSRGRCRCGAGMGARMGIRNGLASAEKSVWE